MKISFLGHAGLLVECRDFKALVDPVIHHSMCEGLNSIIPKRLIDTKNIPEYDFIIISHKHFDHFDKDSLASLDKTKKVYIPKDKYLEKNINMIGFSDVSTLGDFEKINIKGSYFLATPSVNKVPEFGILFSDMDGTFWSQVDTVSTQEATKKVLQISGGVDYLLAPWQPLLEGRRQSGNIEGFPYEVYYSMLKEICFAHPRFISPGACGFKYIKNATPLNHVEFPVSRKSFLYDIQKFYPPLEKKAFSTMPGDIVVIEKFSVKKRKEKLNWIKLLEKEENETSQLYYMPNIGGTPFQNFETSS